MQALPCIFHQKAVGTALIRQLRHQQMCIRDSGYTVQIGDDLVHLNESDVIFIASGVKHRLIAPDTGKRLILQIEWSAVSKIKELNSILTLIAPAITLTPETSCDIHSNIRKLLLLSLIHI